MNRAVLVVIVALVIGIGAAGFVYYRHKQNTLVEMDIGSHSVSLQKN